MEFDDAQHRRKPSESFYVLSIPASQLRALCDIRRRTASEARARRMDLGIQRRHNEERSKEIREFVESGFPWSGLSKANRESGGYDDLKKPGWLPTAIVVNILLPEDSREGQSVATEDLVTIEGSGSLVKLVLPEGADGPKWKPKKCAPIEVIDGQHRLWSFESDTADHGDFELPVVAFFGLDVSWQAYLFYVINIKPAKINTSLAFDLYPLLRTEDWLERAGGLNVYRESRAQELTEALWAHEDSPWAGRIDMLGQGGRREVSQAAWVRSLMATFVKKWESTRTPIGGLFGAPAGSDDAVLPWTRSQQAAFLIYIWRSFAQAVERTKAPWAESLRKPQASVASSGAWSDPAFSGPASLPNTDQGVRGLMAVMNDLCFVRADDLGLRGWPPNDFDEATSMIGVSNALKTLDRQKSIVKYVEEASALLADYDWRTYAAPDLTQDEKSAKARFRGSTGYRELRQDLLRHLARDSSDVGAAAGEVLDQLNWR